MTMAYIPDIRRFLQVERFPEKSVSPLCIDIELDYSDYIGDYKVTIKNIKQWFPTVSSSLPTFDVTDPQLPTTIYY